MNTKMIIPMNVIRKFQSQLIKRIKCFIRNKFRIKDFVSCLSNSVIVGTARMTKRTSDFKSVNYLINYLILKLIASVGITLDRFTLLLKKASYTS